MADGCLAVRSGHGAGVAGLALTLPLSPFTTVQAHPSLPVGVAAATAAGPGLGPVVAAVLVVAVVPRHVLFVQRSPHHLAVDGLHRVQRVALVQSRPAHRTGPTSPLVKHLSHPASPSRSGPQAASHAVGARRGGERVGAVGGISPVVDSLDRSLLTKRAMVQSHKYLELTFTYWLICSPATNYDFLTQVLKLLNLITLERDCKLPEIEIDISTCLSSRIWIIFPLFLLTVLLEILPKNTSVKPLGKFLNSY